MWLIVLSIQYAIRKLYRRESVRQCTLINIHVVKYLIVVQLNDENNENICIQRILSDFCCHSFLNREKTVVLLLIFKRIFVLILLHLFDLVSLSESNKVTYLIEPFGLSPNNHNVIKDYYWILLESMGILLPENIICYI